MLKGVENQWDMATEYVPIVDILIMPSQKKTFIEEFTETQMKQKTTQLLEKQIRILKRDKELLKREIRDLTSKNIMLKVLNDQLASQNDRFAVQVEMLDTKLNKVKSER